jgi:sigma-E factor negative regulatory protein RseB
MATFTDGLSVFSVFIESDIAADAFKSGIVGRAQRGATTAYSRDLLLSGNPHRVTVVGEIPAHTAEKIAQSIVLVSANAQAGSQR